MVMKIPAQITAGDSASWSDDAFVGDAGRFLDSAAYTLTYSLRGPSQLVLTAVASGRGWVTTLPKNMLLAAGQYSVVARLTSSTERITVGTGRIDVLADLTSLPAGGEFRTPAEVELAQVEAAISGSRTESYKIGTREAKRYSITDLLQIRSMLVVKVKNERAARDLANGIGNPSNLYVRFR